MGRRAGRPPGRGVLTKDEILAKALAIIDADGADALSMRRLAAELGVDTMAIYHHVPGKEALLSGVAAAVFATLTIPTVEPADWRRQVREFARAYRNLAASHPNLTIYLITHGGMAPQAVLAANETLYAALLQSGLPPRAALRAGDLVVDFVHGFALGESSGRIAPHPERMAATLSRLAGTSGQYPAHATIFAEPAGDREESPFEVELELLLEGIEAAARVRP